MEKLQRAYNGIEILIIIFSFIIGGCLACRAAYFIYAYHFTSALWFMMFPMTTLVAEFVVGVSLLGSAFVFLKDKLKGASFYKLSGVMIFLYTINENLLDFIGGYWHRDELFRFRDICLLVIGLCLYIFFNQKKYFEDVKKYNKVFLLTGVSVFFIIDIIFYNWTYE